MLESKISLFNPPNYIINTADYSHILHGCIVSEFEQAFAEYVGAKYACTANSASSLIFIALKRKYAPTTITIPSIIPPVVPNAILMAGHKIAFNDNIDWVGQSYLLHDSGEPVSRKLYDSAHEVKRNQFKDLNDPFAMIIYSFYPTKPVCGCDGGMIVSDDGEWIESIRMATMNGSSGGDSWERKTNFPGYKMHCNSIQAEIAFENLKMLDRKKAILGEIRLEYNGAFIYNNVSDHLYRIRVEDNRKFIQAMNEAGIQCGVHYPCCHLMPCYPVSESSLPNSELEAKQTVSIPFHENLRPHQIRRIIENVKKLGYKP